MIEALISNDIPHLAERKQRYLPVAVNLLPICPRRAEGVPPE
jgi:hypothetical protein